MNVIVTVLQKNVKFFLQDLDSDSETELDYKVSILMVIALHGFNKFKFFCNSSVFYSYL